MSPACKRWLQGKPLSKDLRNSFRCLTVPQRRPAFEFASAVQRVVKMRPQQFPITAYQDIRALSHCNRTLRILTQSQARNSQISSLLLYPTRVRDHHCRMFLQSKKLKVSKGIDNSKIRTALPQPRRPLLLCPGMHRKIRGSFSLKLSSTCRIGKKLDSSSTFDGR